MKKYAPDDCKDCKLAPNCEGTLVHKKQKCEEWKNKNLK